MINDQQKYASSPNPEVKAELDKLDTLAVAAAKRSDPKEVRRIKNLKAEKNRGRLA